MEKQHALNMYSTDSEFSFRVSAGRIQGIHSTLCAENRVEVQTEASAANVLNNLRTIWLAAIRNSHIATMNEITFLRARAEMKCNGQCSHGKNGKKATQC